MKSKIKYGLIIFIIFMLISLFFLIKRTYSKYVIIDKQTAFHIDKLMDDKVKPTIDGTDPDGNKNSYTDEEYYTNKDQKIDYDDNIKVADARYWYNEDEKEFTGDGTPFESGTTFSDEGWYKIVITDIFDNTNTVIFLLDKTLPTINANSSDGLRKTSSSVNSNEFKMWFISDVDISEFDKYGIKLTYYSQNASEQTFNSIKSQNSDIGKGTINNIWKYTDKSYYKIVATDLCNNTSTLVIGIDKVAPTITTLSSNYTELNKNLVVKYTDDFSGVKSVKYAYNASNNSFSNYNNISNNTTLSNSGYYHFILEDNAGNTNEYTVAIDKEPPVISVKTDGNGTKNYSGTSNSVVNATENVTLTTSDNFAIDYNEYWYNPNSNSFNGNSTRFDNGKKLTDEGYYKIIAHDKFGNTSTIVILIDKTPPEVTVKFYKKSDISMLTRVGGGLNG